MNFTLSISGTYLSSAVLDEIMLFLTKNLSLMDTPCRSLWLDADIIGRQIPNLLLDVSLTDMFIFISVVASMNC